MHKNLHLKKIPGVFKEMNNENRISIINEIIRLSNFLDAHYASELNFRNHCYLRIAYDNTVNNKWDNVVAKPFIKKASEDQLNSVVELLKNYTINKDLLTKHNLLSLAFRQKSI